MRVAAICALMLTAIFVSGFSACRVIIEIPEDILPFSVRSAYVYENDCHYDVSNGWAVFRVRDRGVMRWVSTRPENVTIHLNLNRRKSGAYLDAFVENYVRDNNGHDCSHAPHVILYTYSLRDYNRWQSRLDSWHHR